MASGMPACTHTGETGSSGVLRGFGVVEVLRVLGFWFRVARGKSREIPCNSRKTGECV